MGLFKNVDWKVVGALLGLMVVVALLWNTRVVYPLKILVVFFHEMSHGLASVLTGGEVVRIQVVAAEGGLCLTRGGNRFLILTAGYLGSLTWGGIILLLAARTRLDRGIACVLGGILVLTTLWLVRPFGSFGFIFGLLAGALLIGVGALLSGEINDYLLRAIGLTSCLYAVLDIKSDILDRPHVRSDAAMLSEHTGLPTLFWGVLWIAIAVLAALFFLLLSCKTSAEKSGAKRATTP